MRLTIVLSLFLLSASAFAGTFTDNFDNNWEKWSAVATQIWDTNVADRVSVVDGVLSLDHINKSGHTLSLYIGEEDWEDYSFSADMRIVKTEPGAKH